jgi:acyl-CoA synthetase (AMP-forming)/AMP-acid ligase II
LSENTAIAASTPAASSNPVVLPAPNVGRLLAEAAREAPGAEYLRFPDLACSYSFGEVDRMVDQAVTGLAAVGVGPGDRVGIMFGNVPAWPVVFLAVLRMGAVSVPVNAQFRTADIAHALVESGARAIVTSATYGATVRAALAERGVGATPVIVDPVTVFGSVSSPASSYPEPEPETLASLQFSSGTTGLPKGCMLTHRYWLQMASGFAAATGLGDDDVALMTQPWSYIDQQWMTITCLITRRPHVVLPKFSVSGFWNSIRAERATITYVLGTMPRLLAKQPPSGSDRNHRMRLVLCSGIPADQHAALEDRWGVPWREAYGSTETGLDLIAAPDDTRTVGTGAMGYPPAGRSVEILDDAANPVPDGELGEIVVTGSALMRGYWNAPEATAAVLLAPDRYRTGDRGFRDELGYIHHAGRIKDMIRRGGENISAAEVESVLGAHELVLNVAVVGIPDDIFGQVVKAFVVLKPGTAPSAAAGVLAEYAADQLARFKTPELVEFVEELPLTPSERVEKKKLLLPGRDQRTNVYDARRRQWIGAVNQQTEESA